MPYSTKQPQDKEDLKVEDGQPNQNSKNKDSKDKSNYKIS